jgi:formylmethanofuran dehydrogenase subunit E-like metal-binding protein
MKLNKVLVVKFEKPKVTEQEEEGMKEIDSLQLNEQVVEEIRNRFGDVSIEEVKRIIIEVTNEVVSDLKVTKYS